MAEYIEREALYEKAYWHGEHPDIGNPFPDGVDAVVVTRCKDCRYRGLICCPAIHETIGNGLVDYAVDNGYCWCGKPKDDQGMMVNAPTVDLNTKTKQQRSFVDPCKDGKEHDWKKLAVGLDAELNTVVTYRCLKCGETFNVKFEKV